MANRNANYGVPSGEMGANVQVESSGVFYNETLGEPSQGFSRQLPTVFGPTAVWGVDNPLRLASSAVDWDLDQPPRLLRRNCGFAGKACMCLPHELVFGGCTPGLWGCPALLGSLAVQSYNELVLKATIQSYYDGDNVAYEKAVAELANHLAHALNGNGISRAEAEAMLDTVTCNPDVVNHTGPCDGVRGLATITEQTTSAPVVAAGPRTAFIVQWDHEPVLGATCAAVYHLANDAPGASNFQPGVLRPASANAGWNTAGLASSLVTGGVTVYMMTPGQSPFPCAPGSSMSGPFPPQEVIQVLFEEDMFHDNTRVLGSFWELVDDTNALNQQGACYQGGWEANDQQLEQHTEQKGNPGDANFISTNFMARSGMCPPGDPVQLTKLNQNRIGTAKEGCMTCNRLDMSNNKPSGGFGNNTVYASEIALPAITGVQSEVALVGSTAQALSYTTTFGLPNTTQVDIIPNVTQTGNRIYQTGVQMNMTILTGLPATWTATIKRKVITQSFTRPGGKYKANARPDTTPVDFVMLARLQNALEATPMFGPSKDNASGKFARMAKAAFNKIGDFGRGAVRGAERVLRNPLVRTAASVVAPQAVLAADLTQAAIQVARSRGTRRRSAAVAAGLALGGLAAGANFRGGARSGKGSSNGLPAQSRSDGTMVVYRPGNPAGVSRGSRGQLLLPK